MKKRFIVVLVVISMALFGSMAFAGDDWRDGFAKALDENNLAGALMLAHNSQASPQSVYEALEAFGVEQEDVEQSIMLAEKEDKCEAMCEIYKRKCCDQSPSAPIEKKCARILESCDCTCD